MIPLAHINTPTADWPFALAGIVLIAAHALFFVGMLPIPVGYDRGKIEWLTWCGTGMHAHICYWHGGDTGLQSIHPADMERGEG